MSARWKQYRIQEQEFVWEDFLRRLSVKLIPIFTHLDMVEHDYKWRELPSQFGCWHTIYA